MKELPTAKSTSVVSVQICLLTYKRPELLQLALHSIASQTILLQPTLFPEAGEGSCRVAVSTLIVDNDERQSAREIAGAVFDRGALRGRYVCEPARGLSSARNRALTESSEFDFAVFLDDDEAASPEWLSRLLHAAICNRADVVTGPVDPMYAAPPAWVVRGGFFSAIRRTTGESVRWVASNNTLISKAVANQFRFDAKFNSSGGEDTEFFLRVAGQGRKMIWCEEARVSETIPQNRTNLKWILQRGWSDANRFTLGVLSTNPGPRTVFSRLATALGGFVAGLALLPGTIAGRHHGARGLQLVWRSCGTITALLGRSRGYYGAANV